MRDKNFLLVAGLTFSLAGLLHLVRSINSWSLDINGVSIPLLVSYVLVVISAVMSYSAFKMMK